MLSNDPEFAGRPGVDYPVAGQQRANGPQADYPVLVGDPYTIAGKTYTPSDSLNYDEVGYLAAQTGGRGVTAAHHTLPVPSYVEITSLVTGRTILARVEERGPMYSTHLVALSPDAMAQLGASADEPVRVRRVNPPEEQRATLRAGNPAPLRMETPMSLVNVLRRQLPAAPDSDPASTLAAQAAPEPVQPEAQPTSLSQEPAADDEPAPAPEAVAAPEPHLASSQPPALPSLEGATASTASQEAASAPAPAVAAAPLPSPPTPTPATTSAPARAVSGGFVVQAAAYSNAASARQVASAIGGEVTQAGRYYRVRTGPFASRAEAEASLAKVRAAGYSEARIFTNS